ncbi:MAG: phospholipase D-like domain-containing protein [Bacteroidota bacterium]|nr:phospholipase D-like domain-containing protein [Bacteroidota bacterium]
MKSEKSATKENYHSAEEVILVYSGEDYFDRLKDLIQSAKSTIHFQTYIFDEDSTGILIADELKNAAKRGVSIHLLIDAFGSGKLTDEFQQALIDSGIHLRMFEPFFSKNTFHLGRRMHHKIIVSDQKTALIGGINIADKYRGSATEPAWLDYAILIRGEISREAERICFRLLNRKFSNETIESSIPAVKEPMVRFRSNDRLRGRNQVSRSYFEAFRQAEKSITLVSSYFLPGKKIRRALKQAASRGIKVTIILAGKSDAPLLRRASYYLYSSLLKRGVELYEWQPSVLHGKLAMVDGKWATIGSFNLNHLSALSSIEMNVDVIDSNFAEKIRLHIEEIKNTGCKKISSTDFIEKNGVFSRLLNAGAYLISRTGMRSLALFPWIFGGGKNKDI